MTDSSVQPLPVLACEECHCVTEDAKRWVSLVVDETDEPDFEQYVVSSCPVCADREFEHARGGGLSYT